MKNKLVWSLVELAEGDLSDSGPRRQVERKTTSDARNSLPRGHQVGFIIFRFPLNPRVLQRDLSAVNYSLIDESKFANRRGFDNVYRVFSFRTIRLRQCRIRASWWLLAVGSAPIAAEGRFSGSSACAGINYSVHNSIETRKGFSFDLSRRKNS